MSEPSRREFLALGLTAPFLSVGAQDSAASREPAGPTNVNLESLIARADLLYEKPVARSEEGIPIGNGRMGSLVWTSPTALKFQINRVDVYPMSSATDSFFERNSDYCGGCGFVDIELGLAGEPVFPETGFRQHLSVFDGLLTVNGNGADARVQACQQRDVIAIDIDDRRPNPGPVSVHLRMLRFVAQHSAQLEKNIQSHIVTVQTRNHTAASQLQVRPGGGGDRIVLTQEFREGSHYNKTAVVAGVVGRAGKSSFANDSELRLTAQPGRGRFTVLVASAASFNPDEDVIAAAEAALETAARQGFAALAIQNRDWWREYWSRGFVQMHSADGVADSVAMSYAYFLYVMASASRGRLPTKFNGMLWNTGGDLRAWGSQHWFANLSCMYEAMPAANRFELLEPVFRMYFGMHDACALAARQQWGSEGIYIPETAWFDGLAALPDDIAQEMQDLYLLRKPWGQRSARFMEFATTRHPHSSRWNWNGSGKWVEGRWEIQDRGAGPYGPVNHSFATTAKIAYLFWRRYEFTLDREWLQTRAYPMLKGAVEFYRHYPKLRKGSDGKYHIHDVNSNESVLGAQDTDEDVSAMYATTAALLRASEILDEDRPLRSAWQEFLANLAPLPDTSHPDALEPAANTGARVWTRGLKPAVRGGGGLGPDGNSMPQWWFDLVSVETRDRDRLAVANATFDAMLRGREPDRTTTVGVLSKMAIAAAALGRAEAVRYLIPNQIQVMQQERQSAYQGGGRLPNGLSLREGAQALDAQSLGRAAEALQLALLQSHPPAPAEDPIIRVFPAWPRGWDASFTLLARGAFRVSSSIAGDRVEFVELESLAGANCRVRNPWGERRVTLRRDGKPAETLSGSLLTFGSRKGERLRLAVTG